VRTKFSDLISPGAFCEFASGSTSDKKENEKQNNTANERENDYRTNRSVHPGRWLSGRGEATSAPSWSLSSWGADAKGSRANSRHVGARCPRDRATCASQTAQPSVAAKVLERVPLRRTRRTDHCELNSARDPGFVRCGAWTCRARLNPKGGGHHS